jgi:hypothetical protein
VEIPPSSSHAENTGLIGLGPHVGSRVYNALNKHPSGDPPLDRIFRQNTSTPNYLTVLLGRSDDPDERFPGDLTVGELICGYENITCQPKLPIADVVASDTGSQHWATLLDEDGIVGSNGTVISLPKSQVAQPVDSGKNLVVVVNTHTISGSTLKSDHRYASSTPGSLCPNYRGTLCLFLDPSMCADREI